MAKNLGRRALRSATPNDSSDEEKDNRPVTRSRDSKKTPSPKKRGYKKTHQSPGQKDSEDDLEINETHSEEEDEVDGSKGDRSGSPSVHDSLGSTPEPSPEYTVKSKPSTRQKHPVDNIQSSSDPQISGNGSNCCIYCLFIMTIVVVAIAIIISTPFFSRGSETLHQQEMDYVSRFKTKLEEMKRMFPSQIDKFWKTISSSMKHILSRPDPAYPAIILLCVPKGFSVTASEFVKHLGKSINSVYEIHSTDFVIDAGDLDKSSPAKEKLDLDRKLQKVLSQSRVVVVDRLEEISPQATLLFHAYCDGDNAPYKNVCIVLVLHSSQADTDLSPRDIDHQLQQIWSGGMDSDEIPALISRVANNVAIVKNEQHAN